MKPIRKVAITSVSSAAKATPAQGQGAKPVRDQATKADASKAEYKRKVATKSAK